MSELFMENTANTKEKREILPYKVGYVYSDTDESVLVAVDPIIEGDTISWFDTIKERRMKIAKIEREQNGPIVFTRPADEGGATYRIEQMNLDIYNDKVKENLISPIEADNENDLMIAFKNTKLNAW